MKKLSTETPLTVSMSLLAVTATTSVENSGSAVVTALVHSAFFKGAARY